MNHRICRGYYVLLINLLLFNTHCLAQNTHPATNAALPPLLLAESFNPKVHQPKDYWVSEKLDGVRAYWNGQQLISRQGNPFDTPAWFTRDFPDQPLDGELWIGRNQFEALASATRKYQAVDSEWRKVKYMIFDLPHSREPFTKRLTELQEIISQITSKNGNPHLQLITQFRVSDHKTLMEKLDEVISSGAEGLMLHRGDSVYKKGRHSDLLKLKRHEDAEAIVIAHLPGKGKYKGMLGALLVEMPDGKTFRIGSGFKDTERANPPHIGSIVTYKFYGKTGNDIPKFASFLRVRKDR